MGTARCGFRVVRLPRSMMYILRSFNWQDSRFWICESRFEPLSQSKEVPTEVSPMDGQGRSKAPGNQWGSNPPLRATSACSSVVERWSHKPNVASSILATPTNVPWSLPWLRLASLYLAVGLFNSGRAHHISLVFRAGVFSCPKRVERSYILRL